MSSTQTLRAKMERGGLIDLSVEQQEKALELARKMELEPFIVECDRARSQSAVLRAIVKAVDFPEFFGSNLDALYDCLSDTVFEYPVGVYLWFHRLHTGDPYLGQFTPAIIEVLNDVAEYARNNERAFAYTIDHAGEHPDPEEAADSN